MISNLVNLLTLGGRFVIGTETDVSYAFEFTIAPAGKGQYLSVLFLCRFSGGHDVWRLAAGRNRPENVTFINKGFDLAIKDLVITVIVGN